MTKKMSWWCKGSTLSNMSEVSGSIPVSGLCFLLIFVVFNLYLPCHSSSLSACVQLSVVLCPRHRAFCRQCLDVRTAPARCNRLGRRCARCVALVQIYNSALLIPNLNRTSPASITP